MVNIRKQTSNQIGIGNQASTLANHNSIRRRFIVCYPYKIWEETIEFLEIIFLCRTFALLIKKDGGIRPADVLATCANKVLHSIHSQLNEITEKIS